MSTYLRRTFSGASTSRKTFTLSFWVKRTNLSSSLKGVISAETNNTNNYDAIFFTSTDEFQLENVASGADAVQFRTSAQFKDPSAWYHVVCAIDTTEASSSNGVKIYINGVLQTSFALSTYNQDATFNIGKDGEKTSIGRRERDGDGYGVGYLSEFYYIDGQQKAATDFGQTDSTTGIWKPKTYSGTYGNNGFRLEFKNSGALGTDTSGNSETFTVNNAGTNAQVVDTATNNFATINSVAVSRFSNQGTISLGNLKYDATANERGWGFCSMGVTKGKWYWEIKATATDRLMIGVGYQSVLDFGGTFFGNNPSKAFSILSYNGNLYYDGTNTSYGPAFVANDIMMVALDMDNYLCWFGKNGTWSNNATQTQIENSTATYDATTKMGTKQNINNGDFVFPFITAQENANTGAGIFNFGNPPFTISSGNADANGHGNFEYAVPSGYNALCTENLNTYG